MRAKWRSIPGPRRSPASRGPSVLATDNPGSLGGDAYRRADLRAAEQLAVVPPLLPAQVQSHGPLPFTAEATPVEHKFLVGLTVVATPFAEPHNPLIASWAEQLAVKPPFDPAQVQAKGPEPVTADAEPALHRLVVGAFVTSVPFAEPQAPLISS
jgi:hypothetical protein